MVDDPAQVTETQMEEWAAEFDSWDVCDQVTSNLFDKTPFAWDKVRAWSGSPDEWVKRAAFATAAALAVQDKRAADEPFLEILELCRREAGDDRNYVKKAVNWALRNIGKRDLRLHAAALETAEAILAEGERLAAADRSDPAARAMRWVARDALREAAQRQGRGARRSTVALAGSRLRSNLPVQGERGRAKGVSGCR